MEVGDAITCSEDEDQCRILLGVWVLGIHELNLKVPWPLSPPSFIHSSSAGIAPSCQVRPLKHLKLKLFVSICLALDDYEYLPVVFSNVCHFGN